MAPTKPAFAGLPRLDNEGLSARSELFDSEVTALAVTSTLGETGVVLRLVNGQCPITEASGHLVPWPPGPDFQVKPG